MSYKMETDDYAVSINDLPEEILEYILRDLSPYRDFKSAMLVCRQWHRLVLGVLYQLRQEFLHSISACQVNWTEIVPEVGSNITDRYSHCSCYYDKSVYIFGGCTSTNTTFNDLWRFDLSSRQWVRPLAIGTYPSPKACASMTVYKDSLVLFGGWSHPTQYPLHQAARFFSELHLYKPDVNRWFSITTMSPMSPKPMAGHSTSIVKDTMVVFGGSQMPGTGTNEVWQFDFLEMVWQRRSTGNLKPSPRYGQTQITLDDSHILIVGGCGGPNQIFGDIWLLSLDSDPWQWEKIHILQPENAAPQLWCHPACKVNDMVVVLSKPSKPFPSSSAENTPDRDNQAPLRTSIRGNRVWVPPRGSPDNRSRIENDGHNVSDSDGNSSSEENTQAQTNFKHPGAARSPRSRVQMSATRGRGHGSPNSSSGHSFSCNQQAESESSGYLPDRSNDASGGSPGRSQGQGQSLSDGSSAAAGLRPGVPSVRPNAMRNRQKQLEALRKFEERLRENRTALSRSSPSASTSKNEHGVKGATNLKDRKSVMHVHVLDIKDILTKRQVTWKPIKENFSPSAPDESIFYSLVEGRGELIMFGGIQRDIQSMQRGMDIRPNLVSNNLYIISPRKHYL